MKDKKYWLTTSHTPHENYYFDSIEQVIEKAEEYFQNVLPYGLLLFELKEDKRRKNGYTYKLLTGFTRETIDYVKNIENE